MALWIVMENASMSRSMQTIAEDAETHVKTAMSAGEEYASAVQLALIAMMEMHAPLMSGAEADACTLQKRMELNAKKEHALKECAMGNMPPALHQGEW
jgi:hypothetical protein